MTTSLSPPATAREVLHEMLRTWEPAAGPTGFEGLVADALVGFTGFTFRLAKSGLQFGRDAATTSSRFAIAMEAKRYTNSVPLQELVGKSTLAAFALAEGVDLWVLAATVEVGETTERQLEQILDKGGISLLTLDWTAAGLPPLAVLLAAVRERVEAFAKLHLDPSKHAALAAGLADIAADPGFDASLAEIRDKLSPGLLGLDACRHANTAWANDTLGSRRLAQRQFSQFLVPLENRALTAERPTLRHSIGEAVDHARTDAAGDTLVLVAGGEGSGKTWAVTNWWLSADPRPILLLSIGRIAEQLSPGTEPVEMLARLAAHQSGPRDATAVARWRRRIERWSQGGRSRDAFVLVVDGLNETSGKAWASILRDLLPAVRDLGGVLVATCREQYWSREVRDRLPRYVTTIRVQVNDYDDVEFADVLRRNGVDPGDLNPRLNAFMRNPRICALALTILPRLTGIQDLSVERLLMEFWRHRLEEREDMIAHNDTDFRDLLVRHAREYRERQGAAFNRDEWRSRSGAAARDDGRDIRNDLTEIEEGRFFDGASSTYQFRPESLQFALGLLISDELKGHIDAGDDLDQAIAPIIDPIRGFDAAADVLTAAVAVSVMDAGYPDAGIAALVAVWISLQNHVEDAFDELMPHIAARPGPFLDAYELRDTDRDDGRFLRFILEAAAERESVRAALEQRVVRWLGSWTRTLPESADGPERERRQTERNEQIDARLASLTPDEQAWFAANCPELARPSGLAMAATLHLAGRAQTPFAPGLVAFAFAYKVGGTYNSAYDELAWVLRLNRIDPAEFAAAARNEVARFVAPGSSALAGQAVAFALRLMGTEADEDTAEGLAPRPSPTIMGGPEPDALDPATDPPPGVAEVAARIAAMDPTIIWNHMSTTVEDHDLERTIESLVRFEFETLREFLDRVARTISTRTGLPLRQLAWHLPWLSPILDAETIEAIDQRVAEIGADPSLAPADDADWITGTMVESVLPTRDGAAQLDVLQSLPSDAPYYFRYSRVAKPLTGDDAANRLAAVIDGDPNILERTLIFLSDGAVQVTPALRDLVIRCLGSAETEVVAAAAEFARAHDDPDIDDAVLALPRPADVDRTWRAGTVSAAISVAIARRGRVDLVEDIPVEHLDWVASRMPAALDRLADTIEATVEMLTGEIDIAPPTDAILTLEVDEPETAARISLEDRGEQFDDPFEGLNAAMSDTTGARFANRRRLLGQQLERFLDSLASAGALVVARRPFAIGLDALARSQSDRYAGWLRGILATTDDRALRNLQNVGLALAQHYAEIDANLSARTFAHLWRIDPHVTVTMGPAKHPIRFTSLFSAVSSEEIDALRGKMLEQASDDGQLETVVLAAEAAGAGVWLDDHIDGRLASATPADQALGITAASMRPANPHSDGVLDRDWKRGFLGDAARAGRTRYARSRHSDHWFDYAVAATHPHERWRYLELAIAAADRRQLMETARRVTPDLRLMGGEVGERMAKAAEKANTEGKKTLFGWRKPDSLLQQILR
ncbi:hypothetical protein [Aureimonas endophytica]|uniref:hypothetical protein n=1 Tax=Aureimonas endophytica TaxID=2027858 RepID=UPI00166F3B0A|nr:hypothetical protein [Aureimonas endophytica]